MNSTFKYLILSACAAATVSYGVVKYWATLSYYKDYLHGAYLELAETLLPAHPRVTIIDNREYKKYARLFGLTPRGLIHAGSLLLYQTKGAAGLDDLAPDLIRYTGYLSENRFKRDIRKYNGLASNILHDEMTLIIPDAAPAMVIEVKNHSMPRLIAARGLYFTGSSAGSAKLIDNLRRYRDHGINTVVFDAKDVDGTVNYYSRVKEVRKYDTDRKRTIGNMEKILRMLKENGFHTVSRIAAFQDHLLWEKEPLFAIRSKRTGGRWNPYSKEKWCDPTNKSVQDYNIDIALELADMGVDEIQFDYIRFPTTGDLDDAHFKYDFGAMPNDKSITHFLRRAYQKINARHARVSVDIFGVVAWGKAVDINKTGQRIELLSRYCDVISPMLYPSHFNEDFEGYQHPGDNPYYFIYNGCRKVGHIAGGRIVVRPWLQAFRWHVSHYNTQYIQAQIKACNDAGSGGYLFWNSSNEYDTVLRALEEAGAGKK